MNALLDARMPKSSIIVQPADVVIKNIDIEEATNAKTVASTEHNNVG